MSADGPKQLIARLKLGESASPRPRIAMHKARLLQRHGGLSDHGSWEAKSVVSCACGLAGRYGEPTGRAMKQGTGSYIGDDGAAALQGIHAALP
jgi:hypothetical protein